MGALVLPTANQLQISYLLKDTDVLEKKNCIAFFHPKKYNNGIFPASKERSQIGGMHLPTFPASAA